MPVPAPIPSTILALAATLCAPLAHAAGPIPSPFVVARVSPRSPATRTSDDLALLRDAAADPASRAAAARRLLISDDPSARPPISDILSSQTPDDARPILIREIRALSTAPGWLLPPLAAAAHAAQPADLPAILDAAGSIRTRDSVRLLLSYTDATHPAPVRDAAFAALARLTGRSDLNTDAVAWKTWFESVQWLPEAEWLRVLAEGLAERADRVTRSRDRWASRAVEAIRRVYVDETRPAERSAMLAAMLGDEMATLRRLGVELANREIANGRLLDGPVVRAAIDLLRDPHPDLRRAAAELVYATTPPDAGAALSGALLTENDPTVAAALLRAVPTWPSATVKPIVIRWLGQPGPAQRPAIEAAAALLERGLIDDAATTEAVLAALRSTQLSELPGAGLRLMALLGTEEDRAAIRSLLVSPTPARRLQAAEALAAHNAYLPSLIDAARTDPALFLTCCRATASASPTVEGFLTAASLPAPNDDTRAEGLSLIVAKMNRRDLPVAARQVDDPFLRELLLRPLTTLSLSSPVEPPDPAVISGLLLLIQTRLDIRQPAGALAAADLLVPLQDAVDQQELLSLRTIALLWLNRIDEAASLRPLPPISAWLDGLERSIDLAHAPDILAAIDRLFTQQLDPADKARLDDLRAKVSAGIMGPPSPLSPRSTPASGAQAPR